ncbi:MAG: hypothetical protein IPP31_11300 [Chitinophagaceae bacterium]|nr:hypothetical protein [Chitinophagaceae bacterium]
MNKEKDALILFETAISFFKDFDLRACAWAQIYCHVSAIRLGDSRIDYFKSAMLFYSKHNYATKETLLLLKEIRSSGIGWNDIYNTVIDNFSASIDKSIINTGYFETAETLCNIITSKQNTKGANAVNNSVSLGEFRQTSMLTKSFLKSLNEDSKQEYLNKISCTDKFYLSPFYNNFIRYLANLRPEVIKKIIIPKLNDIASSRDTFRLFYARFLEKNGFYKESDFLLEKIEVKSQFRYFNNKANVISHNRNRIDEALRLYIEAINMADNDQERSIAYQNQALLILTRTIIERYYEAEAFCMRALELRLTESFWYPFQTIILLRIDKEPLDKTVETLIKCQNEYELSRGQLRSTVNEIMDRKKYAKADKYLLENYIIKPLTL